MIKNVEIKNFKCFEHLKIEGFSRINIISGKNNVGKTALLEALYLPFSRNDKDFLVSILSSRGIIAFEPDIKSLFGPLFFNDNIEKDISINIDSNLMTLKIIDDYLPKSYKEYLKEFVIGKTSALEAKYTQKKKIGFKSYLLPEKVNSDNYAVLNNNIEIGLQNPPELASFINPRAFVGPLQIVTNYTKILELNKKDELLNYLKIIEPRLVNIETITKAQVSYLGCLINGISKHKPITFLGDGINKLIYFYLEIMACKNGYLFIDEIENGFHYSILPKVWAMIAKMAEEYNCQIFATTHSLECLKSAFEKSGQNFSFFRLQSNNGSIEAIRYDNTHLKSVFEEDWDVR